MCAIPGWLLTGHVEAAFPHPAVLPGRTCCGAAQSTPGAPHAAEAAAFCQGEDTMALL